MKPSAAQQGPGNNAQVDVLISRVLRWGVGASLVLVFVGTLLCFIETNDYGSNGGSAADLHRLICADVTVSFTLRSFLHSLYHLEGQAIIVAGLLLLIATPVIRVAISVVAFALEKDWTYVAITGTVLILLILSFVMG